MFYILYSYVNGQCGIETKTIVKLYYWYLTVFFLPNMCYHIKSVWKSKSKQVISYELI